MRVLTPLLLALTGGLLLPLAFSPYDHPWLAPVCLFALFWSWLNAKPLQAFLRGYVFGLGQFGVGVFWVYNSMHDYGGASPAEAGGLTALFVMILAFYPAAAGLLAAYFFGLAERQQKVLLIFPAFWVLCEWLRGWFVADFPWLQVGSSQVETQLGLGLAPLLGVHGVSFAVALLAGLALSAFNRNDWQRRGGMLGIGLILVICAGLSHIQWTQPAGEPFKVALLQGNVPQNQKWVPAFQKATLDRYLGMSREHWGVKLIVWPETAIPAFYQQIKDTWLADLRAEAAPHQTDVILGIPWADAATQQYYNAMVTLGEQPGHYLKRHLVPFGEYLPLRHAFGWVLDILEIPLADFARGEAGQEPMRAAGYPLAASICYEDAFGNEARDALPQAAYLVNVTNDAWFGNSSAPYQHVQMARMRALESGRYLLRATNTGITAVISPKGQIISQAPLFQQASVVAEISPRSGATPYVRFGDGTMVALLLLLLAVVKIRIEIPKCN